ncbi:hypothetical protein [Nostoc sp.]|uniref:hypothetical protein n=1 Tax=Nostoc sp. TaxID=1180 RepID=UPI002FF7D9A1
MPSKASFNLSFPAIIWSALSMSYCNDPNKLFKFCIEDEIEEYAEDLLQTGYFHAMPTAGYAYAHLRSS